jgi:DDE superfamily endonuclease/Homeodomain-like domain-containing protein
VDALLRERKLPPRVRERWEMVKGAALGWDVAAIAAWGGRTEGTVRRWLAAFRDGGVTALAAAVEADPRGLGQGFAVGTAARLSAYLAATTGTRIVPGWRRVLRHRQRFARGRPKHSVAHLQDCAAVAAGAARLRAVGEKVTVYPERDELPVADETHRATTPDRGRVWHRIGQHPVLPAAGTNRRLTVFGRVAAAGRGRIERLGARADAAGCGRYLAARAAHHAATGREVVLVCDNGSCHTSTVSQLALADRADGLEVVPLARSSPALNPKEREWRTLQRDHRRHLAPTLRDVVPELVAGRGRVGGERGAIVDAVPDGGIAGHRTTPTGRPPGRPHGAKDSSPRTRRTNLPAPT